MSLYFTYESRDILKSFNLFTTVKAKKLNLRALDKFEKLKKIRRRGSRSPDNAEFGHFTLLFCREQQKNLQRIKRTRTAIVLLINILFTALLPSPSWFS